MLYINMYPPFRVPTVVNETEVIFPTKEKRYHQKRRHRRHHRRHQQVYQSIKNSWSDKIILEKILDKIILQNEELQLLSQILQTDRIFVPKNNDRFDGWGG